MVEFQMFCRLVKALEMIKPTGPEPTVDQDQVIGVLTRWINKVRADNPNLPSGTMIHFFRFCFPQVGTRRRYGMNEPALSKNLIEIYKLPKSFAEDWKASRVEFDNSKSSGVLGIDVGVVLASMDKKKNRTRMTSSASFEDIDTLLDELASRSNWSEAKLQKTTRTRLNILYDLYDGLNPYQASVITQIILRDLSPLLRPLPSKNIASSLLDANTNSHYTLTLYDALKAWDPRLPRVYHFNHNLDHVLEMAEWDCFDSSIQLGIPIAVSKSHRPGTTKGVTKHLEGLVHCDVKYDGFRAQLHYDSSKPPADRVVIFSKSTRNSTETRRDAIPIFLEAIKNAKVSNGIFECELIPYDTETKEDATFDRIFAALSKSGKTEDVETEYETEESVEWRRRDTEPGDKTLQLKLVFFDILYLNDTNLLSTRFSDRRIILENAITVKVGSTALAKQIVIDFDDRKNALPRLRAFFAEVITDRGEGLMLRSADSVPFSEKIVKLKKDFIPGLGDTVEGIIMGVSWSMERGRELRVLPGTMTTFYIGFKKNGVYKLQFTCAGYGLSRKELFDLNLKMRDHLVPFSEATDLQYRFELAEDLEKPQFMLKDPLVVELTGAGFQRAPRDPSVVQFAATSTNYSLRWPRFVKLRADLLLDDALTLDELQEEARKAMNPLRELLPDFGFLSPVVPRSKLLSVAERREAEIQEWIRRLEIADGEQKSTTLDLPSFVLPPVSPVLTAPSIQIDSLSNMIDLTSSSPVILSNSSDLSTSAPSPSAITPVESSPTPLGPYRRPITPKLSVIRISPLKRTRSENIPPPSVLEPLTKSRALHQTSSDPSLGGKKRPRPSVDNYRSRDPKKAVNTGITCYTCYYTIFSLQRKKKSPPNHSNNYVHSIEEICHLAGWKHRDSSIPLCETSAKPGRIFIKSKEELGEVRRMIKESFYEDGVIKNGIWREVWLLKMDGIETMREGGDLKPFLW